MNDPKYEDFQNVRAPHTAVTASEARQSSYTCRALASFVHIFTRIKEGFEVRFAQHI